MTVTRASGEPSSESTSPTKPSSNGSASNNESLASFFEEAFLRKFSRSRIPDYSAIAYLKWVVGVICTINFLILWAIPIGGMGQVWKIAVRDVLRPVYLKMESSEAFQAFGRKYIYATPRHADYTAMAFLLLLSVSISFSVVMYWQLAYGYVPAWLIIAYFLSWVGIGGRVMGGCYTFAHKEGHDTSFYLPWIRTYVGNVFENFIGPLFGNVPYNFTTSHIAIHHKLNGGKGDTFYQWDLDRTSWSDLMTYQARILAHTTGVSSLWYFHRIGHKKFFWMLLRGMMVYWFVLPLALYSITHSFHFLFYIYFQPLFCMTYFLAFMNFGFHAFIQFDDKGNHIDCVNSTCIVGGDDDYFGEDDHMAHHYSTRTYWRDLTKYQQTKLDEWKIHHASVFKDLSIVELCMLILLKQWDLLAEKYVDHSGKLTKEQIKYMLKARATAIEL